MKHGLSLAMVSLFVGVVGCGGSRGGAGGGGGSTTSDGSGGMPHDTGPSSGSGGDKAVSTSTGGGGPAGTTSATTGSTTGSGGAPAGGSGKWVSGYYVGYQKDIYPPSAIDWSGLTHLIVGRVTPKADGTLDTSFDIDPVTGPALAKDLTSLAHQNGKKAILMVGGAGTQAGFAYGASSQHRAAFVTTLLKAMTDYGFDGLDLDWEPFDTVDHAPLQALAEDLRAALPAMLLTMPIGWVSSNNPSADPILGKIAPTFDQLNIMSYGMAGDWDGWQSWHSSAIYGETPSTPSSVDSSVKAILSAGVPASKLGIGIGFYGSCWTAPVKAPKSDLNGSHLTANDNVMSYTNIMKSYFVPANRHWDDKARAPYLGFDAPHGPEACTFVSYEDEQSILEKGKYVKSAGLGGTIVWTINQGYLPNNPAGQRDPLMQALKQGFLE